MNLPLKFTIVFTIIIQFITAALLSFLLLGCIDTSSNYSNVYLLSYKFNQSSPLYDYLSTSSNSSITTTTTNNNSTAIDELSVKVGYMGVCLSSSSKDISCTTYTGLDSFPKFSISMLSGDLDLVQLAQSFSNICHPRILLTTIILTLIGLIILCYCVIPIVPGKSIMKKLNAGLSFILLLLWGLGSMLQHQAVVTSVEMMQQSSFQLLIGTRGGRAEAMTWTAFSFILVMFLSACLSWWMEIRMSKLNGKSLQHQQQPLLDTKI